MIRKYFPFDKNYLLEQAQFSLEKELVVWLIDQSKDYYLKANNPLGLMDDTAIKITQHTTSYDKRFRQFYADLCGVYRFRYGDNQLEFLFDGTDHFTKYTRDWKRVFKSWIGQLSQSPYFIRTMLEMSVFSESERKLSLAENRLRSYLEKEFNLKLYHYHGIRETA